LGLFVWAIDLDDKEHNALKALLGGKLGIFADKNGYDPTFREDDDWDSATGNACGWSSKLTHCGTYAIRSVIRYCGDVHR